MEFANVWPQKEMLGKIRTAQSADEGDIRALLQRAMYHHVHVDWYAPTHWLGSPSFSLYVQNGPEPSSFVARMIGKKKQVLGCFAATADPAPVAWVRVAAIASQVSDPLVTLAALLEPVSSHLRQVNNTSLTWLVTERWPSSWFPQLGFCLVNEIEVYIKKDLWMPSYPMPSGLEIRPAMLTDLEVLAQIEREAFAPMWRYSATTLAVAWKQALSFDVALIAGQLVGFQLSTRNRWSAHLARMTVAPAYQGHGVGTALLQTAIRSYQQARLESVSLNTQVDNQSSQSLYRKFGFIVEGKRYPIWRIGL